MQIKLYKTFLARAVHIGWPFALILIAFVSCQESEITRPPQNEIVAEIGEDFLTKKDLKEVFGESWIDNKSRVKAYINSWAKDKIVALKATEVLTEQEKDFTKELKKYRNSLLGYAYEKVLLDSLLDTEVTEETFAEYFNVHQKDFELKQNIVRVRYAKLSKKSRHLNKIKYLIQYKDSVQKQKFFNLIEQEGIFCEVNDSLWQVLDDLKNLIPFKLYNDEHFLRHYNYTEAPDGDDVWIMYFVGSRLKKGVAPLDLVKDQIEAIIINKRKKDILQKEEQQLIDFAEQDKKLKIYVE